MISLSRSALIVLLFTLAMTVKLVKKIPKSEVFCLNEDITRHTLVKVTSISSKSIELRIFHRQYVLLSATIYKEWIERVFTTQRFGNYRFCYVNQQEEYVKVTFQLAIGKDINDFGHEDHLEIINTLSSTSAIAEGFINEIVSENADGMSIVLRMKDGDVDYGHHIFFSVFFILVTVAMTGVQHYFIRKHLHKRKYL